MNFWSILTVFLVGFMLYDVKKQGGKTGKQIQKYVDDYFGTDPLDLSDPTDPNQEVDLSFEENPEGLPIYGSPQMTESGYVQPPAGGDITDIQDPATITMYWAPIPQGVLILAPMYISMPGMNFQGVQYSGTYQGYYKYISHPTMIDQLRETGTTLIRF